MAGALVLAGGASRRMGRDKASVELEGRPLLARVVGCLASTCAPIVVAARAGQRLPALGELASSVERVDDPLVGQGPLVGLVAGLERLEARGVGRCYLGSCDAAGLSEGHVRFVLARLERAPAGCIGVVPRDGEGFLHPLAAAVRVSPLLERARAQLARDERRLQRLFVGVEVDEVGADVLPDARVLAPCNTPAQLAGFGS